MLYLTVVVVSLVALTGCPTPESLKDYRYELEIRVTGTAGGTGTTVSVVEPETGADIVAAVNSLTTPMTVTLTGPVDYDTARAVRVSVIAGALPDSASFSVQISYTENAYVDPVSYTIEDGSATNTTGGGADITYRSLFVLPYQPGP